MSNTQPFQNCLPPLLLPDQLWSPKDVTVFPGEVVHHSVLSGFEVHETGAGLMMVRPVKCTTPLPAAHLTGMASAGKGAPGADHIGAELPLLGPVLKGNAKKVVEVFAVKDAHPGRVGNGQQRVGHVLLQAVRVKTSVGRMLGCCCQLLEKEKSGAD